MRLKVIFLNHSLPKDMYRDKTMGGRPNCTPAQTGTYPLAFQIVNKTAFIIEFGIHFTRGHIEDKGTKQMKSHPAGTAYSHLLKAK